MELKRERGPGTRTRYEVDVPTVWVGSCGVMIAREFEAPTIRQPTNRLKPQEGDGEQTEGSGASDAVCIMHAFASRAAAICRSARYLRARPAHAYLLGVAGEG